MVQVRVMGDDRESASRVLAVLLPLLRSCPELQVGDTTELSHRGGGRRVVFDLSAAGAAPGWEGAESAGAEWVQAERTDRPRRPARPYSSLGGNRRAPRPGARDDLRLVRRRAPGGHR